MKYCNTAIAIVSDIPELIESTILNSPGIRH